LARGVLLSRTSTNFNVTPVGAPNPHETMKHLHHFALASLATLSFAACSDSSNPTIPTAPDFAVSVTTEVLETGFDATTGDFFCRVELVATASGKGDAAASWAESQYEFVNVDSGESWVDIWDLSEMIDRFGSDQIAAGESQTTIRRFYSPAHFDVEVMLGWVLPGQPEHFSESGSIDCF
jgi:hypothetical protein